MAGKKSGARQTEMSIGEIAGLLDAAAKSKAPICLVTGGEEALRGLVMDQLLADRPTGVEVIRVNAADPGAARAIDDAAQPSMFGDATWIYATNLEQSGEEVKQAVERVLPHTNPDLRIILEHGGGNQGTGTIRAAEKAGGKRYDARPVADAALQPLLTSYAKDCDAVLQPESIAVMIDILGGDLMGLFGAIRQMAADAAEGIIDPELVTNTLRGGGDEDAWKLADLIWQRETTPALNLFRRLVEREGPRGVGVPIVVALSYSLRAIAKAVDNPPGGDRWAQANALGVAAKKVPTILAQAQLWNEEQLAAVTIRITSLDAAMKGGLGRGTALDDVQKMFTLEKLIIDLTTTQ